MFKRFCIFVLLMTATGVILFGGAFLQEFNSSDVPERLPALGLKLPLEDPRVEISVYRFVVELWDGDAMIKRWEAGFGRSPVAGRVGKELASTPHGEYRIIRKVMRENVLNHGSRFLLLDFPNALDARRGVDAGILSRDDYDRIVAADRADELPPMDTALGGPLGIQGNFFFFRERHFTDGSVAMSNADLNELYEYVPVGTPVYIHE